MSVFTCAMARMPVMRKGRPRDRIVNLGAVGAEARVWPGEDQRVCRGEGQRWSRVAFRGSGRREGRSGDYVNVVNLEHDEKIGGVDGRGARKLRDARIPIGRQPTVEDVALRWLFLRRAKKGNSA